MSRRAADVVRTIRNAERLSSTPDDFNFTKSLRGASQSLQFFDIATPTLSSAVDSDQPRKGSCERFDLFFWFDGIRAAGGTCNPRLRIAGRKAAYKRRRAMNTMEIFAGLIAVALLIYLFVILVSPEDRV